jgi:hypothetical protein
LIQNPGDENESGRDGFRTIRDVLAEKPLDEPELFGDQCQFAVFI